MQLLIGCLAVIAVIFLIMGAADGLTLKEVKEVVEPPLAEIKTGIEAMDKDQKAAAKLIKEVQDQLAEEKKAREAVEKSFNEHRSTTEKLLQARLDPVLLERRPPGRMTIAAAREFGAHFVLTLQAQNKLKRSFSDASPETLEKYVADAKKTLGIEAKAALTTTEFPMPVLYPSELKDLLEEFGVVRKEMTKMPLPKGEVKPARMGSLDDFGPIAMSAAFVEKIAAAGAGSLQSQKFGGIVRIPRELEEQSIVAIGQMLARHGAMKFAKVEDQAGLIGDGTATYSNISGVAKVCADNALIRTLAAGLTSPADAVLEDFRALRRLVQEEIIGDGKYYLRKTWESTLRKFNTQADPNVYVVNGMNATLDGHPIVWTRALQSYTADAAAAQYLCIFGALEWWWFGEHGSPRIDQSADIFFVTDEICVRFIEEIDFDYNELQSCAVLKTPAA